LNVTEQLVRLHRVEQQLRGLRQRIEAAERYLQQQIQQVQDIDARHEALVAQTRQLEAAVHNDETEMAAIDERVGKLREQMNQAKTNKEYAALLTEVNTLRADKSKVETAALERMTKLEEIRAELDALTEQRAERLNMRAVAETQRDQRAKEVEDRLSELERERAEAAEGVPQEALQAFERRAEIDPEEIMAPIDEHSRRNFEYACGACQVMLPMETVSNLLGGGGDLTACVNCGVILYLDESLREAMSAKK